MQLDYPRVQGTLIKRYKRFLADVRLDSGEVITVHCPNSGSMTSCFEPGWKAILSFHDDPKRKLSHTLQFVHNGLCWICVNTHLGNKVVEEALRNELIPELKGYPNIQAERRYAPDTRFDFYLEGGEERPAYVEVKSVSLLAESGLYAFPDAVTKRGQKHLDMLIHARQQGFRAIQLYLIQRSDGSGLTCADWVDPAYSGKLREAMEAGVEVLAFQSEISPPKICLGSSVAICRRV